LFFLHGLTAAGHQDHEGHKDQQELLMVFVGLVAFVTLPSARAVSQ
jgi:hypothetical protein